MTTLPETTARLLITCPDRPGIVSAVTTFLYHHGLNITELDQHSSDPSGGKFFMRLEFQTPNLDVSRPALTQAFGEVVGKRFEMDWRLSFAADKPRMALLVSRHDHALLELLWRWQRGELHADIPLVISNHPDLRESVEGFGVRFEHVAIDAATHAEAEAKMLGLLAGQADLIVLARYMRILSGEFVANYSSRIINIHHSFLPAFVGADPYQQAQLRGVKIIGATAHYVTADLDQGPIIEQDVVRVSHRHELVDLKNLGRDLERQVLARAVRWHVEDRVIVDGNKTVVFS
ncbi:formyltetrahydrofolate deformylase [Solimonas sp. SE-A11]|uniref:formyltetrahydrofolate deformylase n=1 Tax=Solimonas sp. SE-A11 TaxID=3054954 RepID=UPI00259CDA17|nr:formyltetrahydrofolate deformylase [Solimonas sp. SE-A11]MDM4771954.1 formyltetrahydrofolate deformylase [Solimonas sp. SE-A11]